jgi:predicted O-methyltransferase YrrM
MTTLLTRAFLEPHVQAVINQLYTDTLVYDPLVRRDARRAGLTNDGQAGFYAAMRSARMPVTPDFGAALYILARAGMVRTAIEFGTSFGVSTIFLAAAIKANGGGRLVTTEYLPDKIAAARSNVVAAGLDGLVEIRIGDARATLATSLPPSVDLLLLDADKSSYLDILRLVEPVLRPGALVIGDRSDPDGDANQRDAGFLDYLSVPANGYVSASIATRALGHFHSHEIAIRLAT